MQSRSDAPPQQKFGALNMVAALGTHIMSHPEVKNEMEQFILSFVTPALDSSEPYLRAIVRDLRSLDLLRFSNILHRPLKSLAPSPSTVSSGLLPSR